MSANQESQTYRFAARTRLRLSSFRPLTLLSLATATLCIAFFSLSLTRPYMGAEVTYTGGQWRIAGIDPSGLAQEAGLKPGDRVIQINGKTMEEFGSQYVHPNLIRQKAIHQLLIVDNNNRQKSASIEGSPLPKATLFESVSLFLAAIAFCIIGTFVFLKRPANQAARLVYLLCLAIAVCLVSGIASERNVAGALAIFIVASAVFPWLGVNFFMLFPAPKQILTRNRFLSYFIYLPSVIILLLYALVGRATGEEPRMWFRSSLFTGESVGLLLCLACVVHSYLTTTYVRYKQQIKIVGAGVAAAIVPFATLSMLPEATKGVPLVAPQFAVLSTIFIPLSLGYALVKYQLMDIDLIIRRGIVHGSLLLLMAVCYAALGFGLSAWLPVGDGMTRVLYIAALIVLGLLSYRAVADKAQLAIDHTLFKDRYDYKGAVSSMAVMLSSAIDLAELANKVTTTISQLLTLRGACLILFPEGERPIVQAASGIYADNKSEQERLLGWVSHLSEDNRFPHQAPSESGAAIFVPLMARSRLVAMLCLASKATRTDFSVDDLSLLFTLSRQLGVAIDNALLLEQARQHGEQLRESERLYSTMARSSQVGIAIIQDGNLMFVNPQFQKDTGFTEEELVGTNVLSLVHPEDREMVGQKAMGMLREELSAPYEYRVITKSGETRVGLGTIATIQYNGQTARLGSHLDITERKRGEEALRMAALETLDVVSTIIEANDPYTAGHSSRVTDLAIQIAKEEGMEPEQLSILRVAGLLHDTGKVGISQSVLNKPAKLTQAEWLMVKAHPSISAHMAEQVVAFKDAVPAIRHHHERWDGTGYPDSLKAEAIPLLARILAVADAFEAMTSERPYRPARTEKEVLVELQNGAGTQWDPDVVKTFLKIMAARSPEGTLQVL